MFFKPTFFSHRWLLVALSTLWCLGPAHAQTPSQRPQAIAGRDFIVAVVDTVPITNHEVNQRVIQLTQQARQQSGSSPQLAPSLQTALEKLITEKALLQHARDQGIDIDANALNQAQDRVAAQSQLSVEQLRSKLASEGVPWQSFQQNLKTQLILQRLSERNVPSRIRISDAEIDAVMREGTLRSDRRCKISCVLRFCWKLYQGTPSLDRKSVV